MGEDRKIGAYLGVVAGLLVVVVLEHGQRREADARASFAEDQLRRQMQYQNAAEQARQVRVEACDILVREVKDHMAVAHGRVVR